MMCPCGSCHGAIEDSVAAIECTGVCGRFYHVTCLKMPGDLYAYIKSFPGVSWKCPRCLKKSFTLDQDKLQHFLDEKYNEMLANLNSVFNGLKTDLTKVMDEKLTVSSSQVVQSVSPSYSQIAKNKTLPAIIVKPKDTQQDVQKTKVDIVKNINPVDSRLTVSKVKNVREGGVLVGFSSKDDNERFRKIASEKLSKDYEIREIKGIHPRVKIVGMTETYKADEIVEYLEYAIRNNNSGINLTMECSLVKFWPTKNNSKIYQAILQLDRQSYETITKAGGLFVGYDYCTVFDAVEILRCYNCNEFNHSARNCKNKKSCPKCGMSDKLDHRVEECRSQTVSCVNCVKAVREEKMLIDVAHAASDPRCPTYQRTVEKFKKNLLLRQ